MQTISLPETSVGDCEAGQGQLRRNTVHSSLSKRSASKVFLQYRTIIMYYRLVMVAVVALFHVRWTRRKLLRS